MFSCYCVIKSERLSSFSVTPLAIRACCNVGTIVSVSSRQYSKQAWYIQTFIVHTIAHCVVHTNIHCAHHSTLCGRYKHSLCTPQHIMWYIQTYILNTISYHIADTKHSLCTPQHIALHMQNIHTTHQVTRLDWYLRYVTRAYDFYCMFFQ